MATNLKVRDGYHLSVACSDPATPASGDPVRFGSLTGVAITAESEGGNATGNTSVDFGPSVWNLSVKGANDSGNSAVAVGDAIFYVDADTPKLSKKSSGYFFGFALEAVNSGSTTTIQVIHAPSPGSGTLGTGTVGTTNLASGAVTTAKIAAANVTAATLTTTLATGYIPIPLASFREIATNDIPATAADAGVLSSNTTPILGRVNAATDKQLRITWAAGNADEIVASVPYPPDLDDTAAIVVNILAGMAGASDTPVIAVSAFEGVGDTNAGGNTAALAAAVAQKTVTIAAGDVGPYPAVLSIGLVPGTHASDAVYLYGVWLTYTRK
ncbi:MAG: DUF2190 family protein [Chloroflexi bacterium]|nr:DUF2190 family protein [Chloroflexota bacterium]